MTAIVIVGYNSLTYLDACFSTIKRSSFSDYTLIFVDNRSTDESLDFIKNNFPEVMLIENPENYGFAKANNIGMRRALELKASAVMLLNPDTVIDKDCLTILNRQHDDKTILQPLILLDPKKKSDLINTTGGVLTFLGFSYCSDYRLKADAPLQIERPIGSGAAIYIPAAILEKIGLFDESFFMYHEDVDLTWRARLAGYRITLLPEARIWHDYHFSRNQRKLYYAERNRLLFLLKNFGLARWIVMLPLFLLNELAICAYFTLSGSLGTKLRSYASVVKLWPTVMAERKKVQRLRTVSDRQLAPYLSSDIQFSEVSIPLLKPYNAIVGTYWKLIRGA